LADELSARPDDHTITKTRWGALTGTPLHDRLQSQEVTQTVLAGVATSIGVDPPPAPPTTTGTTSSSPLTP
jgi:nicotinamidase-related amidase